MKPKLLIIDDDDEIRTQLTWALNTDYEILQADSRTSALKLFHGQHPQVALLDLGLPPHPSDAREGFAILSEMLHDDPLIKVIIVTGQGERNIAMEAIGAGAFDLLIKPIDLDELKFILKRSCHVSGLERDYLALQKRIEQDSFEGLLGVSPKMQVVFNTIRKVATTDAPVLVLGESGTGKELVAHAIHQKSDRSNCAFVPINCGAIPESLLESELFGHEKGSFTGAHTQRKGRIEHANGGTLFLDEIGEISLPLQVKLLRFLQDQRIERVGGREEIQVDTRVIAATNVNLQEAILNGGFREDLFYRIAVISMEIPPLRERGDDIDILAKEFLRRYSSEVDKDGLVFSVEAMKALAGYSWPGNIRELQNRIRRAVIMAEGKRLAPEDLDLAQTKPKCSFRSLKEARESVEREMVQQALRSTAGKIAPAALALGISRPTFYELMEKLDLKRETKQPV